VLRCAAPPLWWLLFVAEHAAAVPGAEVEVPGGTTGGAIACVIVAAGVWALRSAVVRRLAAAVTLGIAMVLVPVRVWHPGWPPAGWVLAVCDVGQGDGLALSIGDGTAVVIDVGPDPRPIRACLDRLRIRRIALLVLTHPHADHIGGLTGALQGRSVAALAVGPDELPAAPGLRRVDINALDDRTTNSESTANLCMPAADSRGPTATRCDPATNFPGPVAITHPTTSDVTGPTGTVHGPPPDGSAPSGNAHALEADPHGKRGDQAALANGPAQVAAVAARADIPVLELSAGYVMHFGTLELEVLAPATGGRRPAGSASADEANDRSIVLAATTPAGRILLTGDIEAPAQHRLMTSGAPIQADIMKVPHHGSRTTTSEFIAAVHPRLALVSVGAHNTFGHPNPGLLSELAALSVSAVRTDQRGDVLVVGEAKQLRVMTLRTAKSRQ
jgi:competence protein ComEC